MLGYAPRLALLLITLLLVACGLPPFDRMDLEVMVFRSHDLPSDWTVAGVWKAWWVIQIPAASR
jgi:hypothetical protein